MIDIDRQTGAAITGFDNFVSRVTQVMSTPIGAREKRRQFGSRLPSLLSKTTSDHLLSLAQTYAMEAFLNPINGLTDFTPSRVVASRHSNGITLRFEGRWNGSWVEPFDINLGR